MFFFTGTKWNLRGTNWQRVEQTWNFLSLIKTQNPVDYFAHINIFVRLLLTTVRIVFVL